jgi:hypothetical protein
VLAEAALWAFEFFYHQDCANAQMHCAPVRFSPITFRLAQGLTSVGYRDTHLAVAEVMDDLGEYAEDEGR